MTALFHELDLIHAMAGLLVGVLVGLTGVGGGSLMTPLLVLMFGVSPQTAVGTDLLYAGVTKLIGSGVHGWRETVDWTIMRRLASGSIPAASLTLLALWHAGHIGPSTQHVLMLVLGGMLILTSVAVAFQRRIRKFARGREPLQPPRRVILPTIFLGAAIGVAISLSSVGAGAIGVTALLILYPDISLGRIVGTDIAHAVPLVFVGGIGHWIIGDVNGVLLLNLLVGSIPGVIVGSLFSSRASDRWIRPLLAVVLLISGLRLLT
jgi:uncharacterized membrane protein YfcA